jgi:hypothetical protein
VLPELTIVRRPLRRHRGSDHYKFQKRQARPFYGFTNRTR